MKFVLTPQNIESIEQMKQAGADAVVVSPCFFAARGACEIEHGELPKYKEACQKAHLELFVQMNRFFYEDELAEVQDFLKVCKDIAVDGIFFGDEGILQIAKELGMEDMLIYQPDTLLTNHLDVNFYLQQGLHSVVLAKEITLEEIQAIAKKSDASKLHVFIHGRLVMMHSKRNLIHNYMEFLQKDYNPKGKRNLFLMEETRDAHMPIMEDEQGTHVFSGFTQNAFAQIKALAESEIGYVRIDSIFHDDAYAMEALRYYKAILNNTMTSQDALYQYRLKYPQDAVESGFYYTKTSKTK